MPHRAWAAPRRLLGITLLITATAAGAAAAAPAQPVAANAEFNFVVLGDSQFHQPEAFNRIIDQVRLLQPAFAIQVGDMIEGYVDSVAAMREEWRRFRKQIAPLAPVPFLPVPGNHDLYNASRQADPVFLELYEEIWGASHYSFSYRNSRFIILNTDAPDSERRIGAQQFEWLAATLNESSAEHVFIFMHRPVNSLTDAERLHALLRQYPVRYVFYGHHHHYHHQLRDGIRYVMTNAAANSALSGPAIGPATGGMNHFLNVSVRDGATSLAVVLADAILEPAIVHPDDNYDLFEISRRLAPASSVLIPRAERSAEFRIPLENPTSRSLTLYVTCGSADQRWRFEPTAVEPLTLAAGASRDLSIGVSYEPSRIPESEPFCRIRLPFMKANGDWIEHELEVTAQWPTADQDR